MNNKTKRKQYMLLSEIQLKKKKEEKPIAKHKSDISLCEKVKILVNMVIHAAIKVLKWIIK